MGMDLIPTNDIAPFHCNWSSWAALGELLTDAGADLSERAGSNDGDKISESTAVSWADALDRVVTEGVVTEGVVIAVLVEDATYLGGWRTHLRTEGGQVARPVLAHQLDDFTMQFVVRVAHLDADRYEAVRELVADRPTCDVRVEALDQHQQEFLAEAIDFFRHSGGFAQY